MKQIKLKLVNAKIALSKNWDTFEVELNDKIIPINIDSMSHGKFRTGDKLQGVIIGDKFNICREYIHTDLGKLFGFISRDNVPIELIHITRVGGKSNGEIILSKRNLIKNY
jgi:hypothetical protein